MKKSIILIALSTIIMNIQALPTEQELIAEALLLSLVNNPTEGRALSLGINAGSIATATGISAGIITCKILKQLPLVSDCFIGKCCILSAGVAVAWKVRSVTTERCLREIINYELTATESDTNSSSGN
ncbi:hypothetical protein CVU75_00335 [Candidatus Dependentiae bacterium HGW-Dependentiae-1]|nr:MAG: hypothetical protein CVU75_00335 [Candidatus Dependentiae bacterium HGW-Dependentiae-1]